MIKLKAEKQPVENATVEHVYSQNKQILFCVTADEGYELRRTDCESAGVRTVYIPAANEERISLYKSIPKTEEAEEDDGY